MAHTPSRQCLAIVELCISEDGSTRKEIQQYAGYSTTVIGYATHVLMDEHRIYVSAWRDARTQVFSVGDLPNVEPPKPRTAVQRQRRYRLKNAAKIQVKRRSREGAYADVGIWAALMPARRQGSRT